MSIQLGVLAAASALLFGAGAGASIGVDSGVSAVSPDDGGDVDCGVECEACPDNGHEGKSFHEFGANNMQCFEEIPWCVSCNDNELVNGLVPAAEALDRLDEAVTPAAFEQLLVTHGDRMLIEPDRQLLLVRGGSCAPDVLVASVPIDAEALKLAESAGIPIFARTMELAQL